MSETPSLLDCVVCARCRGALDVRVATPVCQHCRQAYVRVGDIPVLLPRPDAHRDLWRRQLGLVLAQAEQTRAGLAQEAERNALLPASAARLQSLATAVHQQSHDMAALLEPALGGALAPEANTGLPRGIVEYIYYLYRDWGWPSSLPTGDENQLALGALQRVVTAPLGRTLVLGAGACRLAYDLHRSAGATETAVVDIDPYLFVPARAVVRGEHVPLTEASLTVQDNEHVARGWTLAAPHGALSPEHFHFFLANGLEPPFADTTFDSIVTPWFIDRVPPQLETFLSTLARLLRPGGRWLNHGPLLYADDTPLARRFGREEVFQLATRAGLEPGSWHTETAPYLVSPLTGRGKLEQVLTFECRLKVV